MGERSSEGMERGLGNPAREIAALEGVVMECLMSDRMVSSSKVGDIVEAVVAEKKCDNYRMTSEGTDARLGTEKG